MTNWSLKSMNVPIGISSYEINKYLPNEEDINTYMNLVSWNIIVYDI